MFIQKINLMKKSVLFLILAMFLSFSAGYVYGQCTPDPSVTDPEGNGEMVPDTIEATESQALNLTLTIIGPTTADIGAGTITIHHITLKSLNNKPTWLSYACNPSNCEFPGGQKQCALITGTPPVGSAGYTAVTVLVDVYASILGNPVLVASDYDAGMPLVVKVNPAVGMEEFASTGFGVKAAQPNPFTGATQIGCFTKNAQNVNLRVFDMMGKMVYAETISAQQGENNFMFDGSSIQAGVYFYSITDEQNQTITRKMIKSN